MALLKLGPVVAGISGSIAGTTFARNRAGYYARQRTDPVQPPSDRRTAAQAILATVTSSWLDDLTSAERLVWSQSAAHQILANKLGEPYTPTGQNLYIRANALLLHAGQTPVTIPPPTFATPPAAFTIDHDADDGIRVTDIGQFDTGLAAHIFIASENHCNQTLNFYKGPYTTVAITPAAAFGALPRGIVENSELTADTRSFIRFRIVLETGEVSPITHYSVDIATIN